MKKRISILLVILVMLGSTIGVSADDQIGGVYEIDHVTVIFDENSQFSTDKQEVIANLLVHPEYGVAQANLICALFGHDNISETVVTITHKVNDTSPRCLQELFTVTSCNRCGETSTERTGYYYITCCPAD
ncbi:MAG: hypothetical protein IJW92_03760 [Clostridia bacterium]|nr:hypothetical protein [Clostridia bacterium]